MICLYNGNYEEHDWSEFYACPQSAEKNLQSRGRTVLLRSEEGKWQKSDGKPPMQVKSGNFF